MRQIAAYLLAVLGGNNNPTVEDLKKIYAAAGVEADEESTKKVVEELKGKNVYELMKAGSSKLATFGGAGRGASAPTGATSAPTGATTSAPTETKKEEAKEEEKAEEESQSMGDLFGEDD